MKNCIREKKIFCGKNYLEVDIFPYTLEVIKKGRSKKQKESLLSQKNLNDKNARRKFVQLGEANFGKDDYVVHLTYRVLPESIEEAEKKIQNYIRRLKRRIKKEEAGELKYMLVTAYGEDKKTGKVVRIHHHMLINGVLTRDVVEELWRERRRKGDKEGRSLGYVNAKKIQPDCISGITDLCMYVIGNPHKRRWTCSQNLERPVTRTNDYRYSKRKIYELATSPVVDVAFLEKKYKGYTILDKLNGFQAVYNEFKGWSIYLKLRKKE